MGVPAIFWKPPYNLIYVAILGAAHMKKLGVIHPQGITKRVIDIYK